MRVKEDVGLDLYYKEFVDKYYPGISVRKSFKLKRQYRAFLKDLFESIQDYIVETGFIYEEKRLGKFYVKEYPTQYMDTGTKLLKPKMMIDFWTTRQTGKLSFFTQGFNDRSFKVAWEKGNFKNKTYYNFEAAQSLNTKLGQYIVKNNYKVNYIQQ